MSSVCGCAGAAGATLVGLSLGILFRARSRGTIAAAHAAAREELHAEVHEERHQAQDALERQSALQREVAELRQREAALEAARREALVEKALRRRSSGPRRGQRARAAPGRAGGLDRCLEEDSATEASQAGDHSDL